MKKPGRSSLIFMSLSLILIYVSLIIALFFHIYQENNQKNILGQQSIKEKIEVSVIIGQKRFSLFGYTSPLALVTLSGIGIADQTTADKNGYFVFNNRFSPFLPKEICLMAQDQFGRTTKPFCLPPFPTNAYIEIGPVILPPTLSLDQSHYYQGDEIKISGQSIPKSRIHFSLFNQQKKGNFLNQFFLTGRFPFTVEAFSFPEIEAFADEKGNFSLSLPTSQPDFFRFFAQTSYQDFKSPDSVNLNLNIFPFWMMIIHFFLLIFAMIKSRILEIFILGEIMILILFFLRRYFHPHIIAKNRALALQEKHPLVKAKTDIVLAEKHLPTLILNSEF